MGDETEVGGESGGIDRGGPERALKVGSATIPLICGAEIPTVYFELIVSNGYIPGMIEVVLATGVLLPNAEGIIERIAQPTAILKCNTLAAQGLRDALTHALAILEKPADPLQSN